MIPNVPLGAQQMPVGGSIGAPARLPAVPVEQLIREVSRKFPVIPGSLVYVDESWAYERMMPSGVRRSSRTAPVQGASGQERSRRRCVWGLASACPTRGAQEAVDDADVDAVRSACQQSEQADSVWLSNPLGGAPLLVPRGAIKPRDVEEDVRTALVQADGELSSSFVGCVGFCRCLVCCLHPQRQLTTKVR